MTDPVTGMSRQLTANSGFSGPPAIRFRSENKYVYDIAYRQDFEVARFAWGWSVTEPARRPIYKVNELEINNEGVLINTFVETTRWFGLKIGLEGMNLLDNPQTRDRTIYIAERGLSPVLLREIRKGDNGRMIIIKVSGSF